MILGRVVGTVVATRKDERLTGAKLLLVRTIDPHGKDEAGYSVAVDTVDAGPNERVLVVTGSSARMATGLKDCPVDAAIVGVVDSVDITGVNLARVIGSVVASRKDEALSGISLLVVQPLRPDRTPNGKPLVALDSVGAGPGEHVFYVRGREAAFPFLPQEPPADACIVGIVDSWHVEPA